MTETNGARLGGPRVARAWLGAVLSLPPLTFGEWVGVGSGSVGVGGVKEERGDHSCPLPVYTLNPRLSDPPGPSFTQRSLETSLLWELASLLAQGATSRGVAPSLVADLHGCRDGEEGSTTWSARSTGGLQPWPPFGCCAKLATVH